jgi:hypothetical protein
MIVVPAKAGTHPAMDTGFRRYDRYNLLRRCSLSNARSVMRRHSR